MDESHSAARIEYEINRHGLLVSNNQGGDITIILPTKRKQFGTVSANTASADFLAFLIIPFVWLFYLIFAKDTPRVKIEITPEKFRMVESGDDSLGYKVKVSEWPRSQIAELRMNKYSPGVYIRIPAISADTYLGDLSEGQLDIISNLLADAGFN